MSSVIKFAYKNCGNDINNNDQVIQCDVFNSWVYIKYNDLNYIDYKVLKNSDYPWLYISCYSITFSFNTVKNNKNRLSFFP